MSGEAIIPEEAKGTSIEYALQSAASEGDPLDRVVGVFNGNNEETNEQVNKIV